MIFAAVSVSGGKDSTITAELALEQHGSKSTHLLFADTGNEHEQTIEYIYGYLASRYGRIVTLKANFDERIAKKRIYIAEKWAGKGVPQEAIDRALSVIHPTGVPFLDLCLWKGRFPSRMAQFCTQELKRRVLDNYLLDRLSEGFECESWRGIRKDESQNRRNSVAREQAPEGWTVVHPIVDWTATQVIEEHHKRGIKLNPLYSQGMKRVGCMPCINCGKDELLEISKRFPHHIDRIREWEALMCEAAKRGWTTFFCDGQEDGETDVDVYNRLNIDARIRWAETARGGRQSDFIRLSEPEQCSSVYGLCE